MRPSRRRAAWHASAALLFVVAACLPQSTNSVFGLSGSIAQFFGAAAGSRQSEGEVTLDEMRRLRLQNLASVAAVLLHGERSQGGACGEGGSVAASLAEHAGAIVADAANGTGLPRDAPRHADGALWGFGDGARPGKRATGGQESAGRQAALGGTAAQDNGVDECMAALLEEVQRLRAENEVLRAHHDQDKSADGVSKLVSFSLVLFSLLSFKLILEWQVMHAMGLEGLLKQSGAATLEELRGSHPKGASALAGWNETVNSLLDMAGDAAQGADESADASGEERNDSHSHSGDSGGLDVLRSRVRAGKTRQVPPGGEDPPAAPALYSGNAGKLTKNEPSLPSVLGRLSWDQEFSLSGFYVCGKFTNCFYKVG